MGDESKDQRNNPAIDLYRKRIPGEPFFMKHKAMDFYHKPGIEKSIYEYLGENEGAILESTDTLIYELKKSWKEIAGPMLARHTIVDRIKNQTLVIRVEKQAYIQELHFVKARIEKRVQELSGGKIKINKMEYETGKPEFFRKTDSSFRASDTEIKKEKPIDDFILELRKKKQDRT